MSESSRTDSFWRRNGWRVAGWSIAVILFLVPFVSMQFTDEVNWEVSDFLVFGAMLLATGGALELAARLAPNKTYLAAVGVALLAAFMLVWVNAAVGFFGSEGKPGNLMVFAVLAVGFVGAVIARRKANAMAGAMVATAIAQTIVAMIAIITGLANTFVVTVFFVALWLTSAWLFTRSGKLLKSLP